MNPSLRLLEEGQSVWYDNIQRSLMENGVMAEMIARGEIRGVTSNPSIFMNAIAKTHEYDQSLAHLDNAHLRAEDIFFSLAIEDIQAAADLFWPLYAESQAGDGYVSLEVSPYLAAETEATVAQARQLWERVDRPNLMIKIPATKEGLPAITQAIAAGVNVNVTLIFSVERYREVVEAYLQGLEQRAAAGLPIDGVASVASFFVSRLDSKVDGLLEKMIVENPQTAARAKALLGKTAIANTKLAYAAFAELFSGQRFAKLKALGGRVQRPLWASTGTKNAAYSDVLYVEELIGRDTVNTIPPHTLAAFLNHGKVRPSLMEDLPGARSVMDALQDLGLDIRQITQDLEDEGVMAFADAFGMLLDVIDRRRKSG